MKTSNKRVGILLVVWICVIAGVIFSEAFDDDITMDHHHHTSSSSSGDDSGDPYHQQGLVPASLHHLPESDHFREALMDLFGDVNLDADAIPLYIDEDSNVWVEHNHEFYALLPDLDDHMDGDGDDEITHSIIAMDGSDAMLLEEVFDTYIDKHQQQQAGDRNNNVMTQAVNNIVGKLFHVRDQTNNYDDECSDCDQCGSESVTTSILLAQSTLPPSEIERRERQVLVDFFQQAWNSSTMGSSAFTRVDESKHVCQFRGVLCEHRVTTNIDYMQDEEEPPVYQVVTRLELTNANLQTTLPSGFADLRHLTVLNLAGNRLHGSLPQEYVNMSYSLYYFDVGENNITGTIPDGFLATSTGLQEFRVNHNSLTGPMPGGSEDWESLKVLDVSENFLTGGIPSRLALLPNLQYLIMGNNFVSGTFPSEFINLEYLYTLDAGSNFMSDSLDHVMQLLPPRLSDVNLEDNFLHGPISEHLFEHEQLELLFLSHNALTGKLPNGSEERHWSDLPNLRALHLTDNQLTGPLPPELFTGLQSSLTSITLGQNHFNGTIPSEIGELSSLFIIDAMSNQLGGTLPTAMLQLNRNLRFNFSDNLLTGTIPGLFCGEGATATSMLYQENGCDAVLCRPGTFNIHGHATLHTCCRKCPSTDDGEAQDPPISQILGRTHCEGLEYVHGDLDGDGILSPREVLRMIYIDTLGRFWGPSYQRWANMTYHECDLEGVTCVKGKVTKLDLTNANMCSDGNRKPGPIAYCKGLPAEIGELRSLEVLQLSRRQFLRGSLPSEVGRLTNLRSLDVSNCVWLTGSLPKELGQLTALKTLKIVHTQIRGTIPTQLFVLSSLEVLHLTNNKLTGTLPSTRLPNVKELMIARNTLQGTLPTTIGDLKKLENFEAYHNDFTGRLPNEFGACSLLKRIDVFNNQFSGTIPSTLLNIDALQILHLKGNQFTGTIPELGKLPRMSWIDVSNNNLHGTVPQSLGSSAVVEDLRLGGNMLYDPIPRGLCLNPNVNGGATKQYGCDGILCPLGTYAETSGHASETYGPCVKCPSGETTMYLGSFRNACREVRPEEILTMFFEVMQGDVWPVEAQRNWGDLNFPICEWAGISCDANGELMGIKFPLVGLDDY